MHLSLLKMEFKIMHFSEIESLREGSPLLSRSRRRFRCCRER